MTRRPSLWPDLPPPVARVAAEDYEERAAILEYSAELPRADAEAAALRMVEARYQTRGELGRAPR
jgi:hypothetical protein